MNVVMTKWPTEADWAECKRRALKTMGFDKVKNLPEIEWKKKILKARHSPIRYLVFSFDLEVPYWVSTHLCRHVHAQPYIQTQRNDRQKKYDREKAPQGAMVKMTWDMEAEELMTIMNKRLCHLASPETRQVVQAMKFLVLDKCPEFEDELIPNCELYHGCREMQSCGRYEEWKR